MTYKPEANRDEVEAKVQARLEEILTSMVRVTTMYVEPGDTVIVHLKEGTSPEDAQYIGKQLKHLFPDNGGMIDAENTIVKIEILGHLP